MSAAPRSTDGARATDGPRIAEGPRIIDGPPAWRRLGLALAIATVGNAGMWSIVALMPGIEAEFAVARADASLPYTLTMAGFGIGSILIGRVADRTGIAPALAAAGVLLALAYAAAAFAPSLAVVAGAQFLIGLGTAATFAPLMADVSRWFKRRRGMAIGVTACGNYLSGAVWPPILAQVMQTHDWRAACLVLAASALVGMPGLAFALRGAPPVEIEAAASPAAMAGAPEAALAAAMPGAGRGALRPRALVAMLGVAGFACCMAMAMPQVHIVALCVDYGFGPAAGAEMLSLMLIGGCFSRVLSGLAADRYGGVMTLLTGSALQMIALALYLPFDALVPLYAVSFAFGLAQGGIVPSYAVIVREHLPAKDAGAMVGLVIFATIAGMAAGGWASGWIYDVTGSYQAAFLNGIAWNMLNIAVVLAVVWRTKPRREAAA